jgi:hypothetical protein
MNELGIIIQASRGSRCCTWFTTYQGTYWTSGCYSTRDSASPAAAATAAAAEKTSSKVSVMVSDLKESKNATVSVGH